MRLLLLVASLAVGVGHVSGRSSQDAQQPTTTGMPSQLRTFTPDRLSIARVIGIGPDRARVEFKNESGGAAIAFEAAAFTIRAVPDGIELATAGRTAVIIGSSPKVLDLAPLRLEMPNQGPPVWHARNWQ
jgi:hypothetical protein